MAEVKEFISFAAGIFGVPAGTLTLETSFGQIPEWDSMAHLRLVTGTASTYGVEIPFAEVTSARSLWEFWRRISGAPQKKVIAVDLDNTLWDGIVGEDGLFAIRPKADFQQRLKDLKDRGALLVAISKNNPQDLEWLFGQAKTDASKTEAVPHGMVLTADDFVARRINWRSKADNLADVARELNLGIDAFVFVDDNPAERLEMGLRLPAVTIAEFPPFPEAYFPPHKVTAEDRVKTEQYRAEALRVSLLSTPSDQTIFERLEVRLDIHELKDSEVPRVAQLSQRANQFSVLTNRRTEDDIRKLSADGLVVTAHAGDRFGDQGLVAFAIVQDAEIVDWVMSCRVMGRGIEDRVERRVEELARARGVSRLNATWRKSGRNEPARELFDRLGFNLIKATETERRYERVLG